VSAARIPGQRALSVAFLLWMLAGAGCDVATVRDFIEDRVQWFNRDTALYITSTYTGRIYRYDFAARQASLWFSTGENGTGPLYFHNDVGYVAVGAAGSNPGLYRFDPKVSHPLPSRVGQAISAQYVAFFNDTKAYVTDYAIASTTGVYVFDPSNPSAGLSGPIAGTDNISTQSQQHIIVGVDNRIYVTSWDDPAVLQINPASDTVLETWTPSQANSQGLFSHYEGIVAYVYLLCNNAVDRFQPGQPGGNRATVATGLSANRMVYHAATNRFYAVGYAHTYLLTPGSIPWTVAEIKDDGASFGGSDMLIHGDLVLIADHNPGTKESRLHVIDASTQAPTSYSPVPIMEDGVDGASNLALY